jgi:hypothetical protein
MEPFSGVAKSNKFHTKKVYVSCLNRCSALSRLTSYFEVGFLLDFGEDVDENRNTLAATVWRREAAKILRILSRIARAMKTILFFEVNL